MNLDPRIIEGKRPLSCFDTEEAKQFVGKECYFSNYLCNFNDINSIAPRALLHNITEDKDASNPYYSCPGYFAYCLPCEWVEQPKTPEFEPYTLETFETEFNIGDVVTFKGKPNTERADSYFKCVYSGYRIFPDNIIVFFGLPGFTFSELFDFYEINRGGNWEPFGRKVETIDLNAI